MIGGVVHGTLTNGLWITFQFGGVERGVPQEPGLYFDEFSHKLKQPVEPIGRVRPAELPNSR